MNYLFTSIIVLISISKVLSLIGSDSGLLDGIADGALKTLPVKTDNLPLGPVKDPLKIVNGLPVGAVKGVAGNTLNNIPVVGGVKGGSTEESAKAAGPEALGSNDDDPSQKAAAPVSPGKNKRKGKEGNNKKRSDKTKSTSKKQRQAKGGESVSTTSKTETTDSNESTDSTDSTESTVSTESTETGTIAERKGGTNSENKITKGIKDTQRKVNKGLKKGVIQAMDSFIPEWGSDDETEYKRRRKAKSNSGKQRKTKQVEKRDVGKYLRRRYKRETVK